MAELDAEYTRTMEDVLALYEKPYDPKEPVVCLDDKPVSLRAEVSPPRPARPRHVAKRDREYERHGTANIFGVVEPKAGRHFTCSTPKWSAAQFAEMMQTVVTAYPRVRTILIWNRRANRRHTTITWRFTRKDARRKFGYKTNLSKRSET